MIDFCPVGCDGTGTRKRQHRLVMALRRRPRPRRGLIAREGVMAVNAFAGAWYAISGAPDVLSEWAQQHAVR